MKSWLFIGASVVSVPRGPWRHSSTADATTGPNRGDVCIVTGVVDGRCHFLLPERIGISIQGWGDVFFDVNDFRPVTDISQFRQIVADVKAGNLVQYNDKVPA